MAALQTARLAAFANLPETQITALIASPTTELVTQLLTNLEERVGEHEKTAAEKLRLEVELENAIRTGESKVKAMRGNIEKAQKQITELRQQFETEQNAKFTLQAELSELKNSTSSSATDLATLQQRITSLESNNRDTLVVLESKSKAYDELSQDLAAKHQKTVELRREVSDLEEKVRAAESTARSSGYREEALQQEVESLKRSNDYFERELKTKSEEHTKFRSENRTRISSLQRQIEDNASSIEASERSEKALRQRAGELEQKTEEYLQQIQQVKEELTRQEGNFRAELDTANRLSTLMQERVETEKARHDHLQNQFETMQDEARDEFAKIQEELETTQSEKNAAEKRIAELETQVERLESDVAAGPAATLAQMATPRIGSASRPGSAPRTPQRGMSPAVPGSAMKATGMSTTQIVTQYHEMRRERDAARKRAEELSGQLDQLLQDFEQRRPAFEQLTVDHERLQTDVQEMASLVESIGKERDVAKKEAKRVESEAAGLTREGEILRQQLRDLSSQIKVLLLEVNARDQGRDAFTPEERVRLEQLASADEEAQQYANDTDRFVSENLVTFRNISELQTNNVKMMNIVRDLGNKLEGEETRARQNQAEQDHEELLELRQKYERCRDEIKALLTQSQSYIKERDIFRRMLRHRGQLPAQADVASMFGESVNGDALRTPARNGVHPSVEMSPNSKEVMDLNRLIKEMQSNMDSYKNEAFEERKQLKDQVENLNAKTWELRNEVSRKSGELLTASERYEMLQGNFAMLKNENVELQKRTQLASDRASQQELRVQTMAEDLVESRGLAESMRKENANLKAEREFQKTVEKRLTEDSTSLVTERDRLNTLNFNLQNLLNEREHSDGETRRRLQTQIDTLEAETQTAKRKLADAEEETKRNSLQRDYERQESQTRIDDLVKNLGSVREEFAAAKATRDQLQLRVDELTIELRSAEERLQVLTAQPATADAGDSGDGDNTMSITQDQDMALQLSQLKRDLELAKKEITGAQEQVEQYKSISQSSEEQLESLNSAHDEFKQEMDTMIEQKEARVKELEQMMETMRAEADERNTELETLHTEKDNHDRTLKEQRVQLENEIGRIKDVCERAEAEARFARDDLKAQAEIAREAQENYDTELQRHAEASKSFQAVRAEVNQLRLELVELRTGKESAEQNLMQGEEAWSETRARFEQEINEIRTRRDDVNTQNKILHEQLEKVNNQIVELQRARVPGSSSGEEANLSASQSNDVAGLQELIKYLRREKEIVDIQYQQTSLESKRQRQDIDRLTSQLDVTKAKLHEQLRSEEEKERSALNAKQLQQTVEQLNILRESNQTLRDERQQAQKKLEERIKEVESLQGELQPLRAKVQELEEIGETLQEDLRMAREARERFEKRYHDVLSKTDAVDPAEFKSMQEEMTSLQAEREELKTRTQQLQTEIDAVPTQMEASLAEANEAAQERQRKIIEQAKQRSRDQSAKIREKETALQQATDAQQLLQTQLTELRNELGQAQVAKTELEGKLEQAQSAAAAAAAAATTAAAASSGQGQGQAAGSSDAEVKSLREQLAQTQAQVQANAQANGTSNESAKLQEELGSAKARVTQLENEVSAVRASLEQAQAQVSQLQSQKSEAEPAPLDASANEALRQELMQAIQDVLALRESSVEEGEEPEMNDQTSDKAGRILAELVARHEKRVADVEAQVAARVEAIRAEYEAKQDVADASESVQQVKADYEKQIESLNERHQSEVAELQKQIMQAAEAATSKPEQAFSVEAVTLEQARDLARSNKHVRELLLKNITGKVNQAKEVAAKELAEKLAEAEEKAKGAQDKAVQLARDQAQQMEEKKNSVKLNMAQNQVRVTTVKINYIKQAASETPEKGVGEVWEVAKDLKPPQPPAPAAAAAAAGGSSNNNSPNTATPSKPTGGLGSSQYAQSPLAGKPPQSPASAQFKPSVQPATNPFAATPAAQAPAVQNQQQAASGAPATNPFAATAAAAATTTTTTTAGQPPSNPAANTPSPANPAAPTLAAAPAAPAAPAGGQPSTAPAAAAAPATQTATQPAGRGGPAIGAGGTGRGGSGGVQSGLPVAGGRGGQQAARGHLGPGRGRGRGRGTGIPQPGAPGQQGGVPGQQQQQQQQQQAGGPGNMNATAKQFVPQKRGLDASEHAGGDGKRMRGGKS